MKLLACECAWNENDDLCVLLDIVHRFQRCQECANQSLIHACSGLLCLKIAGEQSTAILDTIPGEKYQIRRANLKNKKYTTK